MRFEKTLKASIYEPWKSHYIDYTKLKCMLREDDARGDVKNYSKPSWTEDDESAFVEQLVNVQLESVNAFQVETYKRLQGRTSRCETELEDFIRVGSRDEKIYNSTGANQQKTPEVLSQVLSELDSITTEINELEKFSRLNFTGFLKAAKKHDRRRGLRYKVLPLLQVRLAALPFNAENYSPLLYRLSAMYSFVRHNSQGSQAGVAPVSETKIGGDKYKSYKFWVHPENILEVKTYILRRLPVLVFNPQTSKIADSCQSDPTITSLYFDNPQFSLYNHKVSNFAKASSLRLRWFGRLGDTPEILLERKITGENGDSEEARFPIKKRYVQPYILGEYKLEKRIAKLRERQGSDANDVIQLEQNVEDIQNFIEENALQPVLRANYTRTAFQIPGDDRVRISLDTELAFIREDALDIDRPCRSPDQWHRAEIDVAGMGFPFSGIRQREISLFPYAILEIKVRNGAARRTQEWIDELMSSHLVKSAPRFSKFVHGIAQLFEDQVNSFPFWLKDSEIDIRRDPGTAFQEEQEEKAKQTENESAAGSLLGNKSVSSFRVGVGSPVSRPATATNMMGPKLGIDDFAEEADSEDEAEQTSFPAPSTIPRVRSFLPPFSSSKYARAHRSGPVQLPPGLSEPGQLIKDSGPVRVEPKVWLANQRTFIKWQHISVLLASLSLGLYNAAGVSNSTARALAVVYTLIAAFAGIWGWWMYQVRSQMIQQRSGKDFDAVFGPILICIGLIIALMINFVMKYRTVDMMVYEGQSYNEALKRIGRVQDDLKVPGWIN